MAADSTMLRMVNLLIALSFGVQREQLEQRIGLTCPRPFLLRPLDARFLTILADSEGLLVVVYGAAFIAEALLCVKLSRPWALT